MWKTFNLGDMMNNWTDEDIQIVKDTLNEISETLLDISSKLSAINSMQI